MSNEGMNAGQLLKQANQLKRAGMLDEAIALYHRVIKINPNFAWAYNNFGDAFVGQGNSDEAIVKYRRAMVGTLESIIFSRSFFCRGRSPPLVFLLEKVYLPEQKK